MANAFGVAAILAKSGDEKAQAIREMLPGFEPLLQGFNFALANIIAGYAIAAREQTAGLSPADAKNSMRRFLRVLWPEASAGLIDTLLGSVLMDQVIPPADYLEMAGCMFNAVAHTIRARDRKDTHKRHKAQSTRLEEKERE